MASIKGYGHLRQGGGRGGHSHGSGGKHGSSGAAGGVSSVVERG